MTPRIKKRANKAAQERADRPTARMSLAPGRSRGISTLMEVQGRNRSATSAANRGRRVTTNKSDAAAESKPKRMSLMADPQLAKRTSIMGMERRESRKSLMLPHTRLKSMSSAPAILDTILGAPTLDEAGAAPLEGVVSGGLSTQNAARDEAIIMALANLFVAEPATLTAFGQLVPDVFDSHLRLGSAARSKLNKLLLEKSFDENLEKLFAESDELVKAPFFWNAEIIPLCTKARIAASYATLNRAKLQTASGTSLHLYSSLLSLLLRLASAGGTDAAEIARRTKEVLDQFERNADQQQFLLSIFLKLDERTVRAG